MSGAAQYVEYITSYMYMWFTVLRGFYATDQMTGCISFLSVYLLIYLSACLFCYNFWTVRYRNFKSGMHTCTPQIMAFKLHQGQWPGPWPWHWAKTSFFELCCRRWHHQHILFLNLYFKRESLKNPASVYIETFEAHRIFRHLCFRWKIT